MAKRSSRSSWGIQTLECRLREYQIHKMSQTMLRQPVISDICISVCLFKSNNWSSTYNVENVFVINTRSPLDGPAWIAYAVNAN